MLSIAMFAIIGANIDAGVAYWICFGVYCVLRCVKMTADFLKAVTD